MVTGSTTTGWFLLVLRFDFPLRPLLRDLVVVVLHASQKYFPVTDLGFTPTQRP